MLGLVLSVIGLHGVVTYLVERRTREIGIRMALGASTADIRRHVFGQGWRLIGTGLAIGLALAAAAARMIAASVHGVSAADPMVFSAAAAVVSAAVALAALWLPARRAARTDIRWWRCGSSDGAAERPPGYSYRNARIGSTCGARCAGMRPAQRTIGSIGGVSPRLPLASSRNPRYQTPPRVVPRPRHAQTQG